MREATDAEFSELGLMPGEDCDWLARTFDPTGSDKTVEADTWIRETPEGIQIARHPEAALRDEPMLVPIITQWNAGLWRKDLTLADYRELSAFEADIIIAAQQAHRREQKRRDPPKAGET